jgi:natural product biosynthesis luciferase-like monooxygenase protein
MSARREMEQKALALWRARRGEALLRPAEFARRAAASAEAPAPAPRARSADDLAFSLMFFSATAGETARPGLYRLVTEAARFADARGFAAVWMPERHFHPFGGPYPNPAVLAAALASVTRNIRLRAGSVVLPLHHPAEVVEAWSMVDNLSNGRVELGFAPGWSPNDFALAPENFPRARELIWSRCEEVRKLWRGESLDCVNGLGASVPLRVFPRPVQSELPVWISTTGNPETFARAGAAGFGVLTMLFGGVIEDIAPKIAIYRRARGEAGLHPDGGQVALMLHTFVHPDGDFARSVVRDPFLDYVRNSVDAQRHGSEEGRAMSERQRAQIADYAFERYSRSAALFGAPAECRDMLERAAAAGVDEIACLIDFGVDEDLVLRSLEHLDALRPGRKTASSSAPAPARAAGVDAPIAIIGMSGRFAGAGDLDRFWRAIRDGEELLSPPSPGRGGPGLPPRAGFLDDIERFDAALFGLAPAEAAAMDPHQRLFLEEARRALDDAGLRPSALRGSRAGVFAAVYSTGYEALLREKGEALDGLAAIGAALSMVPNRTSFLFDFTGPSEAVNAACASGLLAVHRAAAALRAGECDMALAGGVSLLLAPEETAALARLGVLSPDGACRAFDEAANGQARGEGVGVVVLKRLADAERDGDVVHAVLRGSAVNHAGGRSGSVTLPNPRLQAECMAEAIRRSGLAPEDIGYIEAHGAGSKAGDMAELSAFAQAFERLGRTGAPCVIGSVKPLIGSLDAAGGIAGLIKAVLALRHAVLPGTPRRPEGRPIEADARLRFADATRDWPAGPSGRRAACVHAYGLGGTNAHLVLEESPAIGPRGAASPPPSPSPAAREREAAGAARTVDEGPNLLPLPRSTTSWPGSSRPSTPTCRGFSEDRRDVDVRARATGPREDAVECEPNSVDNALRPHISRLLGVDGRDEPGHDGGRASRNMNAIARGGGGAGRGTEHSVVASGGGAGGGGARPPPPRASASAARRTPSESHSGTIRTLTWMPLDPEVLG